MADVHDPGVRSYNMSQIKSKNTKPELIVRKFLHHNGYRYGLHSKGLPGKPDLVLRKHNTIIFIHGCFWHGHGDCKYFVIPKTRTEWWLKKINRNRVKDKENELALLRRKWQIITIWECELKKDKLERTLNNLIKQISND